MLILNEYPWSTREMIRQVRQAVLAKLLSYKPIGRRPCLPVIVDLTSLEKRGKFKPFDSLISVLDAFPRVTPSCALPGSRRLACALELSGVSG